MKKEERKQSLVHQLTKLFVVIVLLPILLFSTIIYYLMHESYQEEQCASFETILTQYADSVNAQLGQYRSVLESLRNHQNVVELLQLDNAIKATADTGFSGLGSLYSLEDVYSGSLYQCSLYSIALPTDYEYSCHMAEKKQWYQESVARQRIGVWIPSRTEGQKKDVLYMTLPIYTKSNNFSDRKISGILRLELFSESLFRAFYPKELGKKMHCLVVDDLGETVFRNSNDTDKIFEEFDSAQMQNIRTVKENQYYFGKKLKEENLYMLCCVELPGFGNWDIIRMLFVCLLGIAMLFIFFMVIHRYMKGIAGRMSILNEKMNKLERLDFSEGAQIEGNDEFAQISSTFDRMAKHIEQLLQQNYQQKIEIQEAQISALYFQINPHFLYNSLESISSLAQEEGSERAAQMTQQLGKMFRYSTYETEDGMVQVSEEISYVNAYVDIQNIRFENKFRVFYEMSPEVMNEKIVKFSLQPVIENAIRHAFVDREKGMIAVSGFLEKDCIRIVVRDDGCGMSEEQVANLTKNLNYGHKTEAKHGIGLANVHRRLQLTYGEKFGITIKSVVGKGTEITLRYQRQER